MPTLKFPLNCQLSTFNFQLRWLSLISLLSLLSLPLFSPAAPIDDAAAKIGRGVNLGNSFEAPKEGQWGFIVKPADIDAIKAAGFDSVRVPISWAYHADPKPPYTIDPKFFARIDEVIDLTLAHGLTTIMNDHHENELDEDPPAHHDRFIAIWKQLAEHYKGRPDNLYFELLNEPHAKLDDALWNKYLLDALAEVRAKNPKRPVIIGPASWNAMDHLPQLKLPEDDRNIIVTVHYYNPFHFTHQGADWAGKESAKWLGTTWTATPEQRAALAKDFAAAAKWGADNKRPIYLGEFGAYSKGAMDSRARWTAAVAREAESHHMAWGYWEFCQGFGVYDPQAKEYRQELLKALVPESKLVKK